MDDLSPGVWNWAVGNLTPATSYSFGLKYDAMTKVLVSPSGISCTTLAASSPGGNPTGVPPPPPETDTVTIVPLTVSCRAVNASGAPITRAFVGEWITWKATPQGGDGSFSYAWGGSNYINASSGDSAGSFYDTTGQKSAVVTLRSAGVATSASCTIDVAFPVPLPPTIYTNTPACTVGEGKIQVWWDAVSGATSYKLYRSGPVVVAAPKRFWATIAHAQTGTEIGMFTTPPNAKRREKFSTSCRFPRFCRARRT